MKKIYSNIIPLKGFIATVIWPFLFIRRSAQYRFDEKDECHERIHGEQQKEMLGIGAVLTAILLILGCGWWSLLAMPLFFWWYVIEWLIKCVYYRNPTTAYKNIGFEREAFRHQGDLMYLYDRKPFAWIDELRN